VLGHAGRNPLQYHHRDKDGPGVPGQQLSHAGLMAAADPFGKVTPCVACAPARSHDCGLRNESGDWDSGT